MKTIAYPAAFLRVVLGALVLISVLPACEKATSISVYDGSGGSSSGSSSSGGSSSGGSSSSGGNTTSGNYFSCDINGAAYNATTVAGVDAQSIGGIFGVTGMTGNASNAKTFTLTFLDTVKTGSVVYFDGFSTTLGYSIIATSTGYAISDMVSTPYGYITITNLNTASKTITGTFSQTTLYNSLNNNDSVVVTNGKFQTSYSVR